MMNIELDNRKFRIGFRHLVPLETVCIIKYVPGGDESHVLIAEGVALCSEQDTFCRTTGRKVSLARALKNANFSKKSRKTVWDLYNKMVKNAA